MTYPGYFIDTPSLPGDALVACKACTTLYLSKIPGAYEDRETRRESA